MKLVKRFHAILGCEVWELSQRYIDKSGDAEVAMAKRAFLPHDMEYRDFVAFHVRAMRVAIRQFIAQDSR